VLEAVTGGNIVLHQEGERRHKVGWLSGTYTPDLSLLMDKRPVALSTTAAPSRTISFRPRVPIDPLVDRIKAAFDQNPGWTIREMAVSLSIHPNQAARKLRQWYESRGFDLPDLRSRGQTLANVARPRNYRNLADAAYAMEQSGLLLREIAEKLNVDRNTATLALDHSYKTRNLKRVDGRTRRKSLAHKR